MKELSIFENIRTSKDENGKVLYVAKDVCFCLGIKDHKQAVKALDEDEWCYAHVKTRGGMKDVLAVNENGLYRLAFSSRKEEAKAFRRWITKEVLPVITLTGKYELKNPHLYLQKYYPNSKKGKAARQIAEKIGFIAEKLCTGKPVYLYDVYAAAVDCGVEKISCDLGPMLARLVLEGMRNNGYRVVKLRGDRYIFEEWEDESNEL